MSSARQRKVPGTKDLRETGVGDDKCTTTTSIISGTKEQDMPATSSLVAALRRQPVWIVLAVSSGACAAFNGVFAKLTTTSLTSTLSSHIALLLSLSPANKIVDFLVRVTFFLLNLAFNAAMWALFTAALTRADSTTRVSIVNVSANFMVTAVLGWMVFGEKLNAMWWGGAAMLAAGNVVIGRREEAKKPVDGSGNDETPRAPEEREGLLGSDGVGDGREVLVELEDAGGQAGTVREGNEDYNRRLRRAEEADAPL